ncbi:hypothetical protein CHS0354_022512, partial [Potamilus streckersoni]
IVPAASATLTSGRERGDFITDNIVFWEKSPDNKIWTSIPSFILGYEISKPPEKE